MTWLATIAQVLLSALAEVLVAESWQAVRAQLSGDPAQRAMQAALLAALKQYAQSNATRPALVKALQQEDGPLNRPHVHREVCKVLPLAQSQPDYALIGQAWQQAVIDPPSHVNFTREAQELLATLQSTLRQTEFFRPFFVSQDIESFVEQAPLIHDSLEAIEHGVRALNELLAAGFTELLTAYAHSPDRIRLEIVDDAPLIYEKTQEFVGRQFVFDAINRFITTHLCGYFFVVGEPGIGKSALAAQLVRRNGYVHHFNRRAEQINTPWRFMKNICSQLIIKYGLPHSDLPADAHQDAVTFNAYLQQVAQRLPVATQAVLVIDALDEVETEPGVNPLFLPQLLPPNLYLIITMRPGTREPRIDVARGALEIHADDHNNQADIVAYLQQKATQPGIQQYLRHQQLDADRFVALLREKCEGNFMYLRYVLPELEGGAYQTTDFSRIPQGLRGYYEDHWDRMKQSEEAAWFRYKLPVVVALATTPQPLTVRQLAADVGLINPAEPITPQTHGLVASVLRTWRQFLDEEEVETQTGQQKGYRVYHESFREYLFHHDEVAAIRMAIEERRADQMIEAFWGKGA